MKIEKITLYHIANTLKEPFITSFGIIKNKETIIIKVESEGIEGWGEAALLKRPIYNNEYVEGGIEVLRKFLIPSLLGKKLTKPEEANDIMSSTRGHNISKAGVEMAIWDLFSKKNKKPLWKYIKGKNKEVEGGISIGIQNKKDMIKKITENKNKRIKIKIKPGKDIEIIKSIREEFPKIKLMVDANAAYRLKDHTHLKKLDKFNLMMIEQPLHFEDIYEHSKLKEEIKTPICLDESIETIENLKAAIKIKAIDILNLKPARVGGITNSLEILKICKQNDIQVWIGGMLETGIGKEFNYQIASREEVTLPGDFSSPTKVFESNIINEERIIKNNKNIILTNKKGIGVTINKKELERNIIKKIIFENKI